MRISLMSLALAISAVTPAMAQAGAPHTVSFDGANWTASDSLRFETWHGVPSVWINRGVALAKEVDFHNGYLDLDIMFDSLTNNAGIAFHARDRNAYEAIFFRPDASGSTDAIQYAPGLNSLAVAWQIWHGEGSEAAASLRRNSWMHVNIRVHGDSADLTLDHAAQPILRVTHLALGADGGGLVGVWAGGFGKGLHVSSMTWTPDPTPHLTTAGPILPGTIMDWEISPVFDAATQLPGKLPAMTAMPWQKVHAESPGLVLINRYRAAPTVFAPVAHVDSVLHGRVAGSKVVYLRTTIDARAAGPRLMRIGFSDAAVIFCNGVPIYNGMHPAYLNDQLGYFTYDGDAVYLPLHAGKNEIVVAVTEFFGGWGFAARLER